MKKIFKYQLRLLLFNKIFIGLLIINCLFAWYILTSDTVVGVANTAPFSPWSFSAYLSTVMPILIMTTLFLMTNYYSQKEKQIKVLTDATPVNPAYYLLVSSAAVAIGFAILCIFIIGLSFYFYSAYFGYWQFDIYVTPIVITILPCFALALGVGHLAGRLHIGLLYALIIATLAMNFIKIVSVFDFFGGWYYTSFPVDLPIGASGEPAFMISLTFFAARLFYLVLGVVLLILNGHKVKRKIDYM